MFSFGAYRLAYVDEQAPPLFLLNHSLQAMIIVCPILSLYTGLMTSIPGIRKFVLQFGKLGPFLAYCLRMVRQLLWLPFRR
ncbi:Uncharacterised protein [Bacillus freudenreichii]|nr:Uncharacterised protein [Bacillus freudenreichii]